MLTYLKKFFKNLHQPKPTHQPEDDYIVTIKEGTISIDHPKKWSTGSVNLSEIHTILLINTDKGPWLPDVWLTLISEDDNCMIPQGAKGFDEIYDIVSKFNDFNFENAGKSMSCTDNAQFLLWTNKQNPG